MKNVYRSQHASLPYTREIHDAWEDHYRSPANERFYELVFDRIVSLVEPPPGSTFLDAGCGPGFHAMRLARRGYRVRAIDFSEAILPLARANVQQAGLGDRIDLGREDLRKLSFARGSYRYVLCWGVLMHVPAISEAVSELSRMVEPGGTLIVAENNLRSPQGAAVRLLGALPRGGRKTRRVPAGLESWKQTGAGPLLTRTADIRWLVDEFHRHGMVLRVRLPGQLTEAYAKAPWAALERGIHRLNKDWFEQVRAPGPAGGERARSQPPGLIGVPR